MLKHIIIRRAILVGLLGLLIGAGTFGYLRYAEHKSRLRNQERIAFALNIDELPDSLKIESAHVDSWTEYHLAFGCADDSGNLQYLLAGRPWTTSKVSPPWSYTTTIQEGKDSVYTIVREAKWHEGEGVSASIFFDQDGERFIVEYHSN